MAKAPNYKFEHNGSSQSWGTIPTGCQQAPQISSLADVNQDGAVEVIGFLTNCPSGNVFIWDSRGRLLPNMPIQAPLLAPNARALIFPPALGDLDGDGDLELITVGGNAYEPGSQAHVYAWHHTGVMVSGWPKDLGYGSLATIGSPTAGDIDGDGRDEIVHVTELIGQWKIDVWRGNGNSATGWPITFVPQGTDSYFLWSPVLGDLDGDGTLEVLAVENQQRDAVYNTRIHAFHGMTGRPVAGWPKDVPDFFAPIFVNFNPSYYYERVHHPILVNLIGDGRPETLMALRRYLPATNRYLDAVFAWQADGSLVGSFPFYLPQDTFRTTNVYGVDLDQDGDQEIGLIRQDETFQKMQVFFWNVPNAVRSDTHPWPMYKHDVRRTNRHVRPVDLVVTRVSGPITGIIGNGATLTATVRNTKTTIAGAFQVGLYLSSDTSITSGDIRLATILVPPLAGGTSKTLSATVTVPSRLMTGAYYWGAIVDSNDDVPETSEANNTLSGNRTKWTKLDMMVLSVSGMPTPNSGINPGIYPPPPPTYTVSTAIRNNGQESSWACKIGVYLSKDATITTADTLVGTYPFAAGLAAGYNTTTTKAFPLPTSLAPGTYYWGAIVDYNNALLEISETNNAKAGNTLTVKAPLGSPPLVSQ
ncbi:MAG: VCBS repeat-containing protein [Candidatus Omnitrophica bacterium]|nr:VCBS repeat-containing protein [Candidatus Omnitrophota bacterium]